LDSADRGSALPLGMPPVSGPSGFPKALRSGIGIGIFLGALDGAVIAILLPSIARDLGGAQYLTWLAGGYALGTAIGAPAWGVFGDSRGHHMTVSIGLWLLFATTLLCALTGVWKDAPALPPAALQLALFRFAQGVASSAIFTGGIALYADMSSIRDRARTAGGFSLMFAVATAFAPAVGGLVGGRMGIDALGVTIAGWQMVFFLQLPLILLALWRVGPPRRHLPARIERFDFGGLLLIASAVLASTVLIYALRNGWLAGQVCAVAALVSALLALWTLEHRVARPILSPQLLAIGEVRRSCALGATTSAALLAFGISIPIHLQITLGLTPEAAGTMMVAFSAGIAGGAFAGGRIIGMTGRLRDTTLAAIGFTLLNLLLLAAIPGASRFWLPVAIFAIGLGFGPLQILNGLFAQHIAPAGRQGAISGTLQFFRRLGGTVGAASSGLLFAHSGGGLVTAPAAGGGLRSGTILAHLPNAAPAALCAIFLVASLLVARGLPRERLA